MYIVGLTGPARCGKDTVGDLLIENYGFVKLSFAAPIKAMVRTLLGMSEAELELQKDLTIADLGVSPRRLMQTLGTEWGRDISPTFWVDILIRGLGEIQAKGDPLVRGIVITDCRFNNEAQIIRKLQGEIWHITRPGGLEVEKHASEAGVSSVPGDMYLCNDASIAALFTSVNTLMGALYSDGQS